LDFFLANVSVYADWITLSGPNIGESQGYSVSPYSYAIKARRVQFVYTKDEISAAEGLPGNITAMGWYIYENPSGPLKNFTIKMAHTNENDVSSHIDLNNPTVVYTDPSFSFANTLSWQFFNFSTPFNWDGIHNIVVDICFGVNEGTSSTGNLLLYNTNLPSQMRGVGSNSVAMCSVVTSLSVSGKPVVMFEMNVNTCRSATNVHFPAVGGMFSVVKWTHPTAYHPNKYVVKIFQSSNMSNFEVDYPANILTFFTIQPATDYTVYVHSKCGNIITDSIGPYNFTTAGMFSLPYTENFMNLDGYHFPTGVSYLIEQGVHSSWEIVPTTITNGFAAKYSTYQNDGEMKAYLISPIIEMPAYANVKISFNYDLLWNVSAQKLPYAKVVIGEVSPIVKNHLNTHDYLTSANVQDATIEANVYYPIQQPFYLSFYVGVEGYIHPCQFIINSITIRELFKNAEIESFSLPEQIGETVIDSQNGTISLNVSPSLNLSSLTPTLIISEGATITPNPSIPQNFYQPVHYSVMAEDTTVVKTWTVYVNGNQSVTSQMSDVYIYPNPASDLIWVCSSEASHIKIYDIRGKIVFESDKNSNLYQINIQSLTEGVYWIQCIDRKKSFVKPFVKQ